MAVYAWGEEDATICSRSWLVTGAELSVDLDVGVIFGTVPGMRAALCFEVESVPEQGSTFTLRLPLQPRTA